MEPERNINPRNIVAGMRVRLTQTFVNGRVLTDEFTVRAVANGVIYFDDDSGFRADTDGSWTLLADAPKPDRPVGSYWRDPETGAEYVKTDGVGAYDFTRIRAGVDQTGVGRRFLRSTDAPDDQIIARLTPIPAFDPATLWPRAVAATVCRASTVDHESSRYYQCDRVQDHDGPHVEHVDAEARYLWGDPR